MKINKATVILNCHTMDCVVLVAEDKPSPIPSVTSSTLDLMFYAAYDTGVTYVKTNFPDVPITIVPRPKMNE